MFTEKTRQRVWCLTLALLLGVMFLFTSCAPDSSEEEPAQTKATTNVVSDSFDDAGNCFDEDGNWVDPEDDMQYQSVESSAFDTVGYSERTRTLDVQFDSTGWYRYTNIDSSLYNRFINADSLGTFYNDYIKGQYPCTQL